MKRLLFSVAFLAIVLGCAKPAAIDGFRVQQQYYDSMVTSVRPAASFALGCPAEELQLTLLSVTGNEVGVAVTGGFPESVGVTGCGKKAIYVHTPAGTWIMNASSVPSER